MYVRKIREGGGGDENPPCEVWIFIVSSANGEADLSFLQWKCPY